MLAEISIVAKLLETKRLTMVGLVSLGVMLTIIGDIFLKRSNEGPFWLLGAGIFFYAMGSVPVIFIFRLTDFGSVFILWEVLTVILAVVIGRVLFGENITFGKMAASGL